MITQPTAEQTRRITRSRTYSGPGFGPRSFNCAGLGLALSLGLGRSSSSASVPVNWSTVFPSTLFAIQSDRGITEGATFTAADQSGNGKDFTAVTTARPTMATGPGGYPEIIFNGSTNIITCAGLALPAPGTTPFFLFLVFRHITYVGSFPVICGNASGTNRHLLYGLGSPRLSSYNGFESAIPADPPAIGSYECTELYRNNTTADYLRRGSGLAASGIATGNLPTTTGFAFGGGGTLGKSNMGLLAAVGCSALPTGPQIAAARAAVTAMYGASILV